MNIETTWTDQDWDKFTTWLKGMLHVGPATVTFTKADGTERVMKCTLKEDLIKPNPSGFKAAPGRKQSDAAMPVWDVEAEGWRAFRWDSIKQVETNLG